MASYIALKKSQSPNGGQPIFEPIPASGGTQSENDSLESFQAWAISEARKLDFKFYERIVIAEIRVELAADPREYRVIPQKSTP
jgi:hypothetical protein